MCLALRVCTWTGSNGRARRLRSAVVDCCVCCVRVLQKHLMIEIHTVPIEMRLCQLIGRYVLYMFDHAAALWL
jgi:hypothetical protein